MKELLKFLYRAIYRQILHFKKNKISPSARFNRKTTFEGYNVIHDKSCVSTSSLGYATYVGLNCNLCNCKIGRFCSIADNVSIINATHPTSVFVSSHPIFYSPNKQCGQSFVKESMFQEHLSIQGKSVIIGNDVWIGSNAKLMGGINIGDGAVVAAGAYVTKDVPPYAIVGGIPAKVIRYRFTQEEINILLKECWWNWSIEKIEANKELFLNIEEFCKKVDYNN